MNTPTCSPLAPELAGMASPAGVGAAREIRRRLGNLRGTLLLLALGVAPLTIAFLRDLWVRPQYQFFPLALVGAFLLARRRIGELETIPAPGGSSSTALWLAAAAACLGFGILTWFPLVGGVAVWLLLAALSWLVGGRRLFVALVPTFLLLLAITPPLGLESPFLRLLRRLAVVGSSRLLDHVGVIHAVEGNVLQLPGKTLLVEEACSGINSVLLGLAVCIFHHFWRRRPFAWLLVTIPLTVAFVLVGNMVRIVLGASLQFHYGLDVLHGWRHETIGLVLLATYGALIISLDHVLGFLLQPSTPPDDWDPDAPRAAASPDAVRPATPSPVFRVPAWFRLASLAFGLAGVASVALLVARPELRQTVDARPSRAGFAAAASFEPPARLGAWERLGAIDAVHQSVETSGVSSRVWYYRLGDLQATVALDFPLRGYHDAKICYTSQGWSLADESVIAPETSGATDVAGHFMRLRLQRSPLLFAEVRHGVIGTDGRWIDPPAAGVGAALGNRIRTMARAAAPTLRLQTLVVGHSRLADDAGREAENLFLATSRLLTHHLVAARH